jgi:hypothetical protein
LTKFSFNEHQRNNKNAFFSSVFEAQFIKFKAKPVYRAKIAQSPFFLFLPFHSRDI